MNSGWICPRCGRVYGPIVETCVPCNKLINKYPPTIRLPIYKGKRNPNIKIKWIPIDE